MAEGSGLLNRYTVESPYRGFESLPLRFVQDYHFCGRLGQIEGWYEKTLPESLCGAEDSTEEFSNPSLSVLSEAAALWQVWIN